MSTPPDTPILGTYRGQPVVGATVSIRNTGHGLEEAMTVDPVELDLGDRIYVVLECTVEKHRHDPKNNDDPTGKLVLVNMLKAGRATIVAGSLVRKHLDDQQRRIEEAEGTQQLPLDDDEPRDGTTQAVGATAEDVLERAEQMAARREARLAELAEAGKQDLLALAREHEIAGRTKLTTVELREAIVDAELELSP